MKNYDLAIINGSIYLNGTFVKGNLYVKNRLIVNISNNVFEAESIYDAKGNYVLPGFIDPHVHFNLNISGGRTSSDDFYSGSIAAAYGGITTYIDFLDPVKNIKEFHEAFIRRSKEAKCSIIDYGFHSTIANFQDNEEKFVDEIKKIGINTVKFFTTYSSSNRKTCHNTIYKFLKISNKGKILMMSHSEDDDLIKEGKFLVREHEDNRPTISETVEVLALAELARETDANIYIVHLSSGKTLTRLKENYNDILNRKLFIESCPQYLYLSKEKYKEEEGYLYTLAPPLRSEEEIRLLKEGIEAVDTIGTDHCPFMSMEKKKKTLDLIPMGIGGIEHSFQLMYTLFGDKIIDKFTINPARIHGLYPKKGVLNVGADADIVIFNPHDEYIIEESHSKCDYDIYKGIKVKGRVVTTISRGRVVVHNGELLCTEGGEYVKREFTI